MCLSWTFHIIGVTFFMAFCVQLLSLCIMISRFIHIIANDSASFFVVLIYRFEREKHWFIPLICTFIGRPWYVPWLDIEPKTLAFQGQCSNQLNYLARAFSFLLFFLVLWAYLSQTNNICWEARSQILPLHSFSWSHNVPQYGWTTSCVSVHELMDKHLGYFHFGDYYDLCF